MLTFIITRSSDPTPVATVLKGTAKMDMCSQSSGTIAIHKATIPNKCITIVR